MTRLRTVPPEGLPPAPIDPAVAHAALDRLLLENPTVIVMLSEGKLYDWVAVPNSQALARGLVEDCLEAMLDLRGGGDE